MGDVDNVRPQFGKQCAETGTHRFLPIRLPNAGMRFEILVEEDHRHTVIVVPSDQGSSPRFALKNTRHHDNLMPQTLKILRDLERVGFGSVIMIGEEAMDK